MSYQFCIFRFYSIFVMKSKSLMKNRWKTLLFIISVTHGFFLDFIHWFVVKERMFVQPWITKPMYISLWLRTCRKTCVFFNNFFLNINSLLNLFKFSVFQHTLLLDRSVYTQYVRHISCYNPQNYWKIHMFSYIFSIVRNYTSRDVIQCWTNILSFIAHQWIRKDSTDCSF